MFNNSNNLVIDKATSITARTYTNNRSVTVQDGGHYSSPSTVHITAGTYIHNEISKEAMKILRQHMVVHAVHNSDERCDAPTCYPETRVAVQKDILSWITHGDQDDEPKKIMWVTGPAGAGKTAIAGSIAETCEEMGILAGSFFFSSYAASPERWSKHGLIATLVYCFLQHGALEHIRAGILSSIDRDPSLFSKRLKEQCRALLVNPFCEGWDQLNHLPLPQTIIIDGVDEVQSKKSHGLERHQALVENEADQVDILAALLQAAQNPRFPFRILIVSRPERAIKEFFSHNANRLTRELHLNDKYDPDSDIALFLRARLAEIRRRYRLPSTWAGEAVVKRLVGDASGQFIYAATVIRFLEQGTTPPDTRLQRLLGLKSHKEGSSPFAQLDALYSHILGGSSDPTLAVKWILAIHYLGRVEYGHYSAFFVTHLLEEEPGQGAYLLENLASLINIPSCEDSESPYELYHKSLLDFLCNPQRCGELFDSSFDAESFLVKQYCRVLIGKGPATALTNVQLTVFLCKFLTFQVTAWRNFWRVTVYMLTKCFERVEGDKYVASCLTECDVAWWMEMAFTSLPVRSGRGSCCDVIEKTFAFVHYEACIQSSYHGICVALCKRWRGSILSFCRRHNWRTPDATCLLRERMQYTAYPDGPNVFDMLPGIFTTNEDPSQCVLEGPDHVQDYDNLLDHANEIFSHLPVDWQDRYRSVVNDGSEDAGYEALRSCIDRIKHSLQSGAYLDNSAPDFESLSPYSSDFFDSSSESDDGWYSDIEHSVAV